VDVFGAFDEFGERCDRSRQSGHCREHKKSSESGCSRRVAWIAYQFCRLNQVARLWSGNAKTIITSLG
jgi:hypothetical protein